VLNDDWRVKQVLDFLRLTDLPGLAALLEANLEALTPQWFETRGSDCVKPLRVPMSLLGELDKGRDSPGECQRHLSLVPIPNYSPSFCPPNDIEVAPVMVSAGLAALEEWRYEKLRPRGESRDVRLVKAVYAAMKAA
jgi:hypothetical protein